MYISKGMKLPTENQNLKSIKLRFRWDPENETWYCFDDNVVGPDRYKEAVAVPDHGDLIDRDALNDAMYHEAFETDSEWQKWDSGCWIRYKMFEKNIDLATVVIPADKE